MEEEDDAALTWKALQAHVDQEAMNASEAEVGDVADFAKLDELPYETGDDEQTEDTLSAHVDSASVEATATDAGIGATSRAKRTRLALAQQQTRFKRKNFSKRLQLLCLQRYADHCKRCGRLPDREECEVLLHQSYAQFVKEDSAHTEQPRFSYPEFLKLIRNRRREMQTRVNSVDPAEEHVRQSNLIVPPSQRNRPTAARGKRKLTEEQVKIEELIRAIDETRASSRLVSEERQMMSHHGDQEGIGNTSQSSGAAAQATAMSRVTLTLSNEPNDLVDTILRLQQETLGIQHVIAERLRSIQQQTRAAQEPSSASV
ncbi:hypothetical protein Poli38472_002796 [Pythium oligandrum]|uniref:Uncharacterized protein n=1 Tax=Pythium oligandrum TaxID=41045 RepID=A0A8K1FHF7_PYTOL|nr:hypothetical protein Poli38472_002796 [Pythium oligandrum]|eukprot:TMW63855.1 hypothetical protein Poli38472_002796 [Pythium oligandrum]